MKRELPQDVATTIAAAVEEVAAGVKRLRSGRLNDKALLLLISHASKQPQSTVKAVLNGMDELADHFLKKQPPKP